MMTHGDNSLSAKISAISTTFSPYPASFNGSGWLYATSLIALMSIAMFGAVTACWMVRDLWRDRYIYYPTDSAFLFRLMKATAGFALVLLCLPDVAYMTCYGEVTGAWMGRIMVVKRVADTLAFPVIVQWATLMVWIYPGLVLDFQSERISGHVYSDPLGVWHRLARPAVIFATIVLIASLMAVAKGALGHHA